MTWTIWILTGCSWFCKVFTPISKKKIVSNNTISMLITQIGNRVERDLYSSNDWVMSYMERWPNYALPRSDTARPLVWLVAMRLALYSLSSDEITGHIGKRHPVVTPFLICYSNSKKGVSPLHRCVSRGFITHTFLLESHCSLLIHGVLFFALIMWWIIIE